MKKFLYGMLTMYFVARIVEWWGRIFTAVFGTPAVKSTLTDATASAIDKAVFGDRPRPNRPYSSLVRYDKTTRPQTSQDDRLQKHIDEFQTKVVTFESTSEASATWNALSTLIERYEAASVSDFYDLVGVQSTVDDNRIGWKRLTSEVKIRRVRDGYVLDLPKPIKL